VIEPGAKLIGVTVAPRRYVQALSIIKTQAEADALPKITQDYPCRDVNAGMIRLGQLDIDPPRSLLSVANAGEGVVISAEGRIPEAFAPLLLCLMLIERRDHGERGEIRA
jgi:hypothetical protein